MRTYDRRRMARRPLAAVLVAAVLGIATGCDIDDPWKTFADTAGTSIGSGVKTIFGGVVDGVVAVLQSSEDESTSGTQTSSKTR